MNRVEIISNEQFEKRAFINGEYVNALNASVMSRRLSRDGEILEGITCCGIEDVDRAVKVAKRAYEDGRWSGLTPAERKKYMLKVADLMERFIKELAYLDAYETGRSYLNYIRDSIPKAIQAVRYFAEAIDKIYDEMISPRGMEMGVITRVPLGVVGIITPWNDPMVVAAWKYAPAMLMGNTVVLKPAEQSSLSVIRMGMLMKEAGIPDGVFNVVPGKGEVAGQALALHPDVRGISFTGSAEIGKQILIYAGRSNMKRVSLECGGKGPYLVSKYCRRLKEAAEVLAKNMFYNQGQICSAPSRAIVQEDVYEDFMSYLKEASSAYLPADPLAPDSEVGCVVSPEQFKRVSDYIELGKKEGARLYQPDGDLMLPEGACAVRPSIFENVSAKMRIAQEEIFGPVLCVLKVKSMEEAVEIANGSEFGLAGAVWSDNLDEVYRLSRKIQVGLLHINSYGNDDDSSPFGGLKQSGQGKDKSIYAFEHFCDKKTVWMHFSEKKMGDE